MGKNKKADYATFIKEIEKDAAKEHYIYYNWYLDIRAGGPTGYLANLLRGINEVVTSDSRPRIWFSVDKKIATFPFEEKGHYQKLIELLRKNDWFNRVYVNTLSRSYRQRYANDIQFLGNALNGRVNAKVFSTIDLCSAKTIHVHTVSDVINVKNELAIRNRNDIKVILTCHVPESVALEYYHNALDEGYSKTKAKEICAGWARIEREAYKQADILIYPSYESMEPAKKFVPDYDSLIKNKDVRFVATGANAILLRTPRSKAKEKYGITGKFVVGYLGRHNSIKGYDLLQRAAKKLFAEHKDIVFLIGGNQGREFKPLRNKRWIECGRVNPADFLPAVDVFVLPNRDTYYDLVLLEVMSAGIPIIASHTGGNISVQKMVPALRTYQNQEAGIVQEIEKLYRMTEEQRKTIGTELKKSYEENFTIERFAQRYMETIQKIYRDYDLD